MAAKIRSIATGSSPRTWGTPGRAVHRIPLRRFIPTHVGNALRSASWCQKGAVHPHARGERPPSLRRVPIRHGSSPRTWGTQLQFYRRDHDGRFIPTHVGNAVVPAFTLGARHGSSPRTWGTHRRASGDQRPRRFIPTHVGNADHRRPHHANRTVHPHARGERYRSSECSRLVSGSSPRTWGTRQASERRERLRRFIPTHVGNARCGRGLPQSHPVHPHARGERTLNKDRQRGAGGSSPRTWGTQFARPGHRVQCRFIPTHVGNALGNRGRSRLHPVHPHARGERTSVR